MPRAEPHRPGNIAQGLAGARMAILVRSPPPGRPLGRQRDHGGPCSTSPVGAEACQETLVLRAPRCPAPGVEPREPVPPCAAEPSEPCRLPVPGPHAAGSGPAARPGSRSPAAAVGRAGWRTGDPPHPGQAGARSGGRTGPGATAPASRLCPPGWDPGPGRPVRPDRRLAPGSGTLQVVRGGRMQRRGGSASARRPAGQT